jgi:hypothetical protein
MTLSVRKITKHWMMRWLVNNELEKMWKWLWPNLRYCPGIFLVWLRKSTKKPLSGYLVLGLGFECGTCQIWSSTNHFTVIFGLTDTWNARLWSSKWGERMIMYERTGEDGLWQGSIPVCSRVMEESNKKSSVRIISYWSIF